MIEAFVTTDTLIKREHSIDNFLATGQADFSDQIAQAKKEIIEWLKSQQKKIRLYCTPLSLHDSGLETSSLTGVKTVEDKIERLLLVVIPTTNDATTNSVFSLYGTNDDTNEVWTLVGTVTILKATTTTQYLDIDDPFKYYRLDFSGASCTYSAHLVESSFFNAVLFHSLEIIYKGLVGRPKDMFDEKANYFATLYDTSRQSMAVTYDSDDDGTVTENDVQSPRRVSFLR